MRFRRLWAGHELIRQSCVHYDSIEMIRPNKEQIGSTSGARIGWNWIPNHKARRCDIGLIHLDFLASNWGQPDSGRMPGIDTLRKGADSQSMSKPEIRSGNGSGSHLQLVQMLRDNDLAHYRT